MSWPVSSVRSPQGAAAAVQLGRRGGAGPLGRALRPRAHRRRVGRVECQVVEVRQQPLEAERRVVARQHAAAQVAEQLRRQLSLRRVPPERQAHRHLQDVVPVVAKVQLVQQRLQQRRDDDDDQTALLKIPTNQSLRDDVLKFVANEAAGLGLTVKDSEIWMSTNLKSLRGNTMTPFERRAYICQVMHARSGSMSSYCNYYRLNATNEALPFLHFISSGLLLTVM